MNLRLFSHLGISRTLPVPVSFPSTCKLWHQLAPFCHCNTLSCVVGFEFVDKLEILVCSSQEVKRASSDRREQKAWEFTSLFPSSFTLCM